MEKNWRFSRFKDRGGVVLLVLLCVIVCQSLSSCWCLNEEGLALLRLREKIETDPFGALRGWHEYDGETDPCSWFGVECSHGKVVALNLKNLCLGGTLAPEIGNLPHIKSIILRNNTFSGIIPEEIGELEELEVLDLGYNNFRGSLPYKLGHNLSLSILLLDHNELLTALSPEVYEFKITSEAQVDESLLSASAEGLGCNTRLTTRSEDFIGAHHSIHQDRVLGEKPPETQNSAPSPRSHNSAPAPYLRGPNAPASPAAKGPTANSPFPSVFNHAPDINEPKPGPNKGASSSPPTSSDPLDNSPPPTQAPPPSNQTGNSSSSSSSKGLAIGLSVGGSALLFITIVGVCFYRRDKGTMVKPWATGLSGQLQKAFVAGVPKLKRSELVIACEDFSNVIGTSSIGTVYKGTLSSGVEIAVASVAGKSVSDWSKNLESQFRKKIDMLSKVNHKNFVNLIGFCQEEEPFTRMMVFEYAPNGTLFEHLHVKEAEHLDWGMRVRIAMGMAYCLEHMHQLNPPIPHKNLTSSAIALTEDYAAKISDFNFWNQITASEIQSASAELVENSSVGPESNVYGFGVVLFEIVTGRLPYSVDTVSIGDWASDYVKSDRPLPEMVDPSLSSFDAEQVDKIDQIIRSCVHPDPRHRPSMREVSSGLRGVSGIPPDGASPKISPLWWAELEILSTDGT